VGFLDLLPLQVQFRDLLLDTDLGCCSRYCEIFGLLL
ncbi:hypothetical protein A2U01_0101950, partial [Trifolium medium]|nr:hypothetical protein [Trifolium medium]